MVRLLEPSEAKVSPIKELIPWVTDITAITLATPMTIPNVVRKLRSPWAIIEANAERELSMSEKSIS
jgi:hypothetical protein